MNETVMIIIASVALAVFVGGLIALGIWCEVDDKKIEVLSPITIDERAIEYRNEFGIKVERIRHSDKNPKKEAYVRLHRYEPNVVLERNGHKKFYRATFEEFPDMLGGIGKDPKTAVKAAYEMLDAEIDFREQEGLEIPERFKNKEESK